MPTMIEHQRSGHTYVIIASTADRIAQHAQGLGIQYDEKESAMIAGMNDASRLEVVQMVLGKLVTHLCKNGVSTSPGEGKRVLFFPNTVQVYNDKGINPRFSYGAWSPGKTSVFEKTDYARNTKTISKFVRTIEDPLDTTFGAVRFRDCSILLLETLPADMPVIQLVHSGESQLPPFTDLQNQVRNRAIIMNNLFVRQRSRRLLGGRDSRLGGVTLLNAPGYEMTTFLQSLSAFIPKLDRRLRDGTWAIKYFLDTEGRNFGVPEKGALVEDPKLRENWDYLWPYPEDQCCHFCEQPLWGNYYMHPMFGNHNELLFCAYCGERVYNTYALFVVQSGRTQRQVLEAVRSFLKNERGLPDYLYYNETDLDIVEAGLDGIERLNGTSDRVRYYALGAPGAPKFIGVDCSTQDYLLSDVDTLDFALYPQVPRVLFHLKEVEED